MNVFQRALFKKSKLYAVPVEGGENYEHWRTLIAATASRKKMIDYITDVGGRSYGFYERYPLIWNVKAYPDLDLEDFTKWLTDNEDFSLDVSDPRTLKVIADAHKQNADHLWQWGIEDACRSLLEDDCYRMTRFSAKTFTWEGYMIGRSGGYFALKEFEELRLKGLDEEELEENLKELATEDLFDLCMFCVEMNICLARKLVEEAVQYQAFWQLARQVEELYEMRSVGKWEVVEAFTYHGVMYFRAKNTKTGEESMLGTKEECEEIVRLAEAGKLCGSFGLKTRQ